MRPPCASPYPSSFHDILSLESFSFVSYRWSSWVCGKRIWPVSDAWLCHGSRVHTLALPVVDKLAAVFRGVDLEAQLSLLAVNLAAKVPPTCSPPFA